MFVQVVMPLKLLAEHIAKRVKYIRSIKNLSIQTTQQDSREMILWGHRSDLFKWS